MGSVAKMNAQEIQCVACGQEGRFECPVRAVNREIFKTRGSTEKRREIAEDAQRSFVCD
jgi:hypothetical protein